MKATITNDFHNSEVTVEVPEGGILSASQTDRVLRELCSIEECTCGRIRGEQHGLPDGYELVRNVRGPGDIAIRPRA